MLNNDNVFEGINLTLLDKSYDKYHNITDNKKLYLKKKFCGPNKSLCVLIEILINE